MAKSDRRSKKSARAFLLVLLAVGVAAGLLACASTPPPAPLIPIKVQLSWTYQAQFAGLYAVGLAAIWGDSYE
jgi:hypothetical protein